MDSIHRILTISVAAVIALSLAGATAGVCSENIVVANRVVARISVPGEFGSVAQRAARIDQRIAQAISVENVGQPNMSVRTVGGAPTLYIGNTMLLKVHPGDAQRYNMTPEQVARQWSANFAAQFPLAEPTIRMGNQAAATELARAQARTAAAANVTVPPQQQAMVAVILDHLEAARRLTEDAYEEGREKLICGVYMDIFRHVTFAAEQTSPLPVPPCAPGSCVRGSDCLGCMGAKLAALGGYSSCAVKPVEDPCEDMSINSYRRINGGLSLMRSVDYDRYRRDRALVALTILRVVSADIKKGMEGAD